MAQCTYIPTPGGDPSDLLCVVGNNPTDFVADCKQLDVSYTSTGFDLLNSGDPRNQGIEIPGAGMWSALSSIIPGEGCIGVSEAITYAQTLGYKLGSGPDQIDAASLLAACGAGYALYTAAAATSAALGGKPVIDSGTLSLLSPFVTALGPIAAPVLGGVAIMVDALCGFVNYYCYGANMTATMIANPGQIQNQLIPFQLAQPFGAAPDATFGSPPSAFSTIAWSMPSCANDSFCISHHSLCTSSSLCVNEATNPLCSSVPCSNPSIVGSAGMDNSYNPSLDNYPNVNTNAPIECAVGWVNGMSIGYDGDVDFNLNDSGIDYTNIPNQNPARLVNVWNELGGEVGHPYGIGVEIPVVQRDSTVVTPDGKPLYDAIDSMRYGTILQVCGRWVTDSRDLWNELHPITFLQILPHVNVSVQYSQLSVLAGNSISDKMTVNLFDFTDGIPFTYSLGLSGLPSGDTYTFNPSSVCVGAPEAGTGGTGPTCPSTYPVSQGSSNLQIQTTHTGGLEPGVYQRDFAISFQASATIPLENPDGTSTPQILTTSADNIPLQISYGCINAQLFTGDPPPNNQCPAVKLDATPNSIPTPGNPFLISTSYTAPPASTQPETLLWVVVIPPAGDTLLTNGANAYMCSYTAQDIFGGGSVNTCLPSNYPTGSSFTPTSPGDGSSAVNFTCNIPFATGGTLFSSVSGGTSSGCSGTQPVWDPVVVADAADANLTCKNGEFPSLVAASSGSTSTLPPSSGDTSQSGTYTVYACWIDNPNVAGYSSYSYKLVSNVFTIVSPPGIYLIPNNGIYLGGGTETVSALVLDSTGNPIVGVPVSFSVTSGPDMGQTGSTTTSSFFGLAPFTFTNNRNTGVDTIQATYVDGSGTLQTSNIVTLSWQNPIILLTQISGGPDTVGGTHTLTATVLDSGGFPMSGVTVTFSVEAGPNLGVSGTAVTSAYGIAQFTYTGAATPAPTPADGQLQSPGGGAGVDFIWATFTDAVGTVITSNGVTEQWQLPTIFLTPLSGSQLSGGAYSVVATLQDGAGNPISGAALTFTITNGPNAGTLLSDSCSAANYCTGSTASDGTLTFSYNDVGGPGMDSIQATFTDSNGITYSSLPAVVSWQNPTILLSQSSGGPDTVGGTHTVTATIFDGAGSPISGAPVSFKISGGPDAGFAQTNPTDTAGQSSYTYTNNGAAGTDSIVATFTDNPGSVFSSSALTEVWTTTIETNSQTGCADLGGSWDSAGLTCTLSTSANLNSATKPSNSLDVPPGDALVITGTGSLTNDGTITTEGSFSNYGALTNNLDGIFNSTATSGAPGLTANYYQTPTISCGSSNPPTLLYSFEKSQIVPNVQFGASQNFQWWPLGTGVGFEVAFGGVISIPYSGTYSFSLTNPYPGGISWLYVDGTQVVNDAQCSSPSAQGSIYLPSGSHQIDVYYIQSNYGNSGVDLAWDPSGTGNYVPIPDSAFSHHGATNNYATITNAGNFITSNGFDNTGSLVNQGGGVITNNPQSTFHNSGTISNAALSTIYNYGTLINDGAGLAGAVGSPGASLALTPSSGFSSTQILVGGNGFTTGQDVTVSLLYQTVTIRTEDCGLVDSTGQFSCYFSVPSLSPGPYTVVASDSKPESAVATYDVTQTSNFITISYALSSQSGITGTPLTITGSGFYPGCGSVPILFGGTELTTYSTFSGSFSVTTSVPNVPGGSYVVQTSDCIGDLVFATFTVNGVIDNYGTVNNGAGGILHNYGIFKEESGSALNNIGLVANEVGGTSVQTGTPIGGSLSAKSLDGGVSVAISGTDATGSVSVTMINDGNTPPAAGADLTLGSGASYYDVQVTGATNGLATVCITPSNGAGLMQYYDSSTLTWVGASITEVTSSTICGQIPVLALNGTPIAIGGPNILPAPEFPLGSIIGLLVPMLALSAFVLVKRRRVGSVKMSNGGTKKHFESGLIIPIRSE